MEKRNINRRRFIATTGLAAGAIMAAPSCSLAEMSSGKRRVVLVDRQ